MYVPDHFKIEDTGEIHAMMRAYPFALLVTQGSEGLFATHLPTVLKVDAADPMGRIECHFSRANPHWRMLDAAHEALLVFQGPQAYIRPGWYASKAEHGKAVPTWNYQAVHAYGRLEVKTDKAWLLAHVSELSAQQEAHLPQAWSVKDAPESYIDVMLRGIVGLALSIGRLEGKAKMSQNREMRDRHGVVAGLQARGEGHDVEVARIVADEASRG